MKILLINPPRQNEIRADNPCFIDEERGHNPPLGLLYIAAYLEKNSSFSVEIVDAQADELSYDDGFKSRVPVDDDLVVGMTVMTFTMLDVLKTIDLLKCVQKESGKNINIVLGGPHATIYPRETAALPGVDYVVRGEGEVPFFKICQTISQGQEPHGIKGVIYKKGADIIDNGDNEFINDLDSLPFPARHLTNIQKYYSLLSGNKIVTTMFTSRGCPFQCAFCDRPHQGKIFRARSAENVVDEMEECIKLGIEEILLYDDTFTVNKQRVLKVCNEIQRRGLNVAWDIRTRVDMVDEEMLIKLKEAGCNRIHFGVEAGTEKILKVLKKGITIDRVKKAFKTCHRLNIRTLAYFMIGAPTETRQDIEESIKLAGELNPTFIHITIFTPYPATAVYNEALANGSIKHDYWLDFARNPQNGIVTPYWYEKLTREELLFLLEEFYRRFYGRPWYILKSLFQVRSLGDLRKKIRMGLKVLGVRK